MPVEIGYSLSSEEHPPSALVANSARAEAAGFSFAMISDHFHPWVPRQGNSPSVWPVLGAIALATESLHVGTGVTCPIIRTHPAIVAQAAATVASMMPGRFRLGLGTGERLNEHVTGEKWPPAAVRLEMLGEAIQIIRGLWEGDRFSHRGRHFQVEDARLYTLPEALPPILVAASGENSARLAATAGDGLIVVGPSGGAIDAYLEGAGAPGPRYAQLHLCWAEDEDSARATAHRWWPNTALPGVLPVELSSPAHYEQAARLVSVEDVARDIPCGPDPEPVLAKIEDAARSGADHVYLHQIGPDQAGFFRFFEERIRPAL